MAVASAKLTRATTTSSYGSSRQLPKMLVSSGARASSAQGPPPIVGECTGRVAGAHPPTQTHDATRGASRGNKCTGGAQKGSGAHCQPGERHAASVYRACTRALSKYRRVQKSPQCVVYKYRSRLGCAFSGKGEGVGRWAGCHSDRGRESCIPPRVRVARSPSPKLGSCRGNRRPTMGRVGNGGLRVHIKNKAAWCCVRPGVWCTGKNGERRI